ncbi:hypothetical protein [Bacillus solimangrovi]|uniref:hypothetical protein n=1 Tax=Bacillus solimangrovi TaxID=1305675 RepID=UPI001C2F9014|nr:hypothetical protein [Bacillus solimangrovi]
MTTKFHSVLSLLSDVTLHNETSKKERRLSFMDIAIAILNFFGELIPLIVGLLDFFS